MDLRRLGAELVDPVDIPTIGDFDDSELLVLLYEFKADLNAYLATLGPNARVKSLAELIAWNERNKDRELVFFGQELFEMANTKGPLTSKEYRDALARSQKMSRAEGLDAALKSPKTKIDALVCPTGSLPWLIDPVNGDSGYFGASTAPAALAIHISPCRPAIRTDCRCASHSSASRSASLRFFGSRSRSSRRRGAGSRRAFHPRRISLWRNRISRRRGRR